ncbi:MAG: helix-turn-helix domain-containing protein [Acholeplasmatales bacterium]|nr:helix-turn-helix domain-containing protein [Acholeplasmatales bacterium]
MVKAIKLILKENTIFDLFFYDGTVKRYDILSLSDKFPQLNDLNDRKLFLKGHLLGWGGVVWNDDLDVSSETVYDEGKDVTNEYDDTDILNIVIGYQIKEKRLQKEMSQEELAKKAGIDQSDLSKIERGVLNPSVKMLKKIAKGLGLKLKLSFE